MFTIRKIEEKDNQQLGDIVQKVLTEMGAPKIGTAYSDPFLFDLYRVYSEPKSVYYVVELNDKIVGGCGIGPLKDAVCELQKMYFLPETRGFGLGKKIIETCLHDAQSFGYEYCYLETMPYMVAAQKLYKQFGFEYIDAPMGETGHTSCPVWMLKSLDSITDAH